MKNILFYYPSKSIGGAELLIIRLAKWIANHNSYNVYICDYPDGFLTASLADCSKVNVVFFNREAIDVPSGTNVVVYGSSLFYINKLFKYDETCRFFVWSVRPDNITSQFYWGNKSFVSLSKRMRIGALLKQMYERKSLFFMDYPNYITPSSFFKFNIPNVQYMQILVTEDGCSSGFQSHIHDNKVLKFVWMSRLDKDKMNELKTILTDLNTIKVTGGVQLSIIGKGNAEDDLKSFIKNKCKFECVFGVKKGDDLVRFVNENADICLAQGTSALEFGKMGKPVILVDGYDHAYPEHRIKYNLLYQMEGYSVGELYHEGIKRNYYFDEAVNFIINNYNETAQKCWAHVKNNFTINIVGKKFVNYLEDISEQNNRESHRIINQLRKEYDNSFMRYYRFVMTKLGFWHK